MKILHTSDWHLGQKFLFNDREEEHRLALDWLLQTIKDQSVEGLIVAGDVFDIGNPPHAARRLYYHFLTKLIQTSCRQVVIIGGNHDSPAMLNAPKDLLATLNIHVVGAATENIEEEVIEWKDQQGNLKAVVAAVPFLRDGDLRFSMAGESGYERVERIREAILKHYQTLASAVERYKKQGVPVLATGHLYVKGAFASDRQNNIYIGDTENIEAAQFPEVFDYIALGHIHRAQLVAGKHHIRYAGSLIPLSFSETKDDKSVYLINFEGNTLKSVEMLPLPTFRRLKTIEGTLPAVEDSLQRFVAKGERGLRPWIEIIVHTDQLIPQLDLYLKDFTKHMDLELLKISIQYHHQALDTQSQEADLINFDVLEVFRKKCESYGNPPDNQAEIEATFLELKEWMETTNEN